MPIGYVIAIVVAAVPTGAALLPPPRSWTLGQVCWRLAFQVNELPPSSPSGRSPTPRWLPHKASWARRSELRA